MRQSLCTLAILFLFPVSALQAQTVDQKPQPGNTGAYAFAFIDHANDAKIGDRVIIDVRLDGGKDNLGFVEGGMLRIKIPFAQWVEIEANAMTDLWQIKPTISAQYNIRPRQNRMDGEPNFKTKVRILKETEKRPAISFQATMKTAAGDFTGTHRYTDSAGYEFSVLASKDIMSCEGVKCENRLIQKIRFLAEVAFIAWDTNLGQQNDSYKTSAAVQIVGKDGFKMKMSFLGFYGWQSPRYDYVSTLQFEASKDLKPNLQAYSQVNLGLSKASTPVLIGGGVRYFLRAPQKFKVRNLFQ